MNNHRFERESGTLEERLSAALAKVALASRHALVRRAAQDGLSAVQAQVLSVLVREGSIEAGPLAARLGLTGPTVSDAVAALERKGYVRREQVAGDRRRVRVCATPFGAAIGTRLALWPEILLHGLEPLSEPEKAVLFSALSKVILSLLDEGVIQEARMCATCSHFRPLVHPGSPEPHHCALVDVPLGPSALRIDCPDHDQGRTPSEALAIVGAWSEGSGT